MAAGVGALGIDGTGDELDEGFQQLLLLLQQALVFDGGGGSARQRLDEADARGQFAGRAVWQDQQQAADQLLTVVVKGLDQQLAGTREGAPVGEVAGPLCLVEGQAEALRVVETAEQRRLPLYLFARQRLPLPDGVNGLHLALLGQEEAAALGLGSRHRLVQDAAEQ